MIYTTTELEQDNKTMHHVCINDTLDILIIKNDNNYQVKVLDLSSSKFTVTTELIDIIDYEYLLNSDEEEQEV